MKKIFVVLSLVGIIILFSACSKEELKLEVYNPEAFAFHIGKEWELNASAQVKGFEQFEENKSYSLKLSYYVNLVTPSGELFEEVDYGMIDKTNNNKVLDTPLEIQLILDGSFEKGDYIMQIFVTDDHSGQTDSTQVKFNLSD